MRFLKLGDYQPVDKTKEREKLREFLEKKDFSDIGVNQNKPKSKSRGLKFDKNGKWIG